MRQAVLAPGSSVALEHRRGYDMSKTRFKFAAVMVFTAGFGLVSPSFAQDKVPPASGTAVVGPTDRGDGPRAER